MARALNLALDWMLPYLEQIDLKIPIIRFFISGITTLRLTGVRIDVDLATNER